MRFSPFRSTGANRSGIRVTSTDSKAVSGNAIRGIGAAIDKSRVSSSGDILAIESGGGTVLQAIDNSPIVSHPFEVTFVGKGGGGVPVGFWVSIEQGLFFGRSGGETPFVGTIGLGGSFNVRSWEIGSNANFIFIDPEVEKIERVISPATTGLLNDENQTIFKMPSGDTDFLIYVECLREYGGYGGQQWDPSFLSRAWMTQLRIKSAIDVSNDILDQEPVFTQDQPSGFDNQYFGYDFGRFVFPIAEVKTNAGATGDQVLIRQLLRSDIFFFPTLRTQYYTQPAPPE